MAHSLFCEYLIKVANKEELADLVIKNGQIMDVFTKDIYIADIAIVCGTMAGIYFVNKSRIGLGISREIYFHTSIIYNQVRLYRQ
ncbi:hypothetical protein [Thermoflavimicrobium daqui]|jgi:adenine deaminase|uniref:Uncharacterized protein n=1 Tax=Thermoflavimicrobium daqui TaxID=2137476 RepID=A0A364K311_9BACL|nr:hypothetical protein [Thermoflavimicrobium daqui]RAL23231.1 hypothetical protein DL897_12780 [Thermoflavimicrobium daqui]